MPPDGGETFIVNLHAPTGERTTMNESSQAHLASLNLDRLSAMDFHSNLQKSGGRTLYGKDLVGR